VLISAILMLSSMLLNSHHNFDNESFASIKLDYFSDTAIQLPIVCIGSFLSVANRSFHDRLVKKAIPLTNMMSAVSTTNLGNR
jgi:hypothetical protein